MPTTLKSAKEPNKKTVSAARQSAATSALASLCNCNQHVSATGACIICGASNHRAPDCPYKHGQGCKRGCPCSRPEQQQHRSYFLQQQQEQQAPHSHSLQQKYFQQDNPANLWNFPSQVIMEREVTPHKHTLYCTCPQALDQETTSPIPWFVRLLPIVFCTVLMQWEAVLWYHYRFIEYGCGAHMGSRSWWCLC